MDNNLPDQQQTEQLLQQPKSNLPKTLAFLKVGLFEFVFVAVVLFLLFGTLNYFNILSVSEVFPNQLGWLPQKEVPTGTSPKQQDKLASQGDALQNSPTNFSPAQEKVPTGTFQYDTKKAEALLTQYIKETIKPEFLPAKIEVEQGLSIDGRTEDIKYQFGSQFRTNQDLVSTSFHYKKNANTPNDFSIFIEPEKTSETTATAVLANSLLTSYFANPYPISTCQVKGLTSYCENFKILDNGKKGYGILIVNGNDKFSSIIFTCFVPKESKEYDTIKSCITP